MKFLFPDRPSIMGILNVTPDSFSDGGQFNELDAAFSRAMQMIDEGADIIDIGGESTRPGAAPVSVAEEIERVIPAVERIRSESDIIISVDTSTPEVMIEAAKLGVNLINDVRALRRAGALEAASNTGLPVCLMHMQGEPETMQENPTYDDVVAEVISFFADRMQTCESAGIPKSQILLDPGFGFGKTVQHNLRLINELSALKTLGCPVLVGLSRKSSIRKLLGGTPEATLVGSLAGAVWAFSRGAQILRVHDVRESKLALTLATELQASSSD